MRSVCLRSIILLAAAGLLLFPLSCVKVRGPGMVPPDGESTLGEWVITSMEAVTVSTASGASEWQWSIVARYLPEEGAKGLTALDISASVDGQPVPFTFEEDKQLFESAAPSFLEAGTHEFSLGPSGTATHTFPTLRVLFEAP